MADPENLLDDFGRNGPGPTVSALDIMARGNRRRDRRRALVAGGTVAVVMLGVGGLTYGLSSTDGRDDLQVAEPVTPSPTTQPTAQPSAPSSPAPSSPDPSSTAPSSPAPSSPAPSPGVALQAEDRLTLEGVGPIRIGMTYAELQAATGRTVEVTSFDGVALGSDDTAAACTYVALQGLPSTDLNFIGGDGQLKAVGASGSSTRLTQSGVRTGDTEARVREVYGSALTESPEMLGIRYLSVVSGSRSLSIGIQNGAAVELWVGESDYTQRPEGCA